MEWHHIRVKKGEKQTCMFGQAIDNYVSFPLAKIVRNSDGSWDWIVFDNINGNHSGVAPSRLLAAEESMKILKYTMKKRVEEF